MTTQEVKSWPVPALRKPEGRMTQDKGAVGVNRISTRSYHAKHFGEVRVTIKDAAGTIDRALNPCLDVRNHSPTGFAWGYEGSGPAQLALAILIDHYKADGFSEKGAIARACEIYQRFKADVIAKQNQETPFNLHRSEIAAYLNQAVSA